MEANWKKLINDIKSADSVKQAEAKYSQLVKSLNGAQKQLDVEIAKAKVSLKQTATHVEKTLLAYKKMALAHKAKLEKALKGSAKKTTKKVAKKKAKRKVSRRK